jgi:hypothetical protein
MTNIPDRIIVWTVQPTDFDLAQPVLEYDHTRGGYWNSELPDVRERYRRALPILIRHFGVKEILWCWSSLIGWLVLDCTKEVAWELDLPTSSVLGCFDAVLWGAVITLGHPLDLARVSLPLQCPFGERCEVLVRWPPGCRFRKLKPFELNGSVDEYVLWRIGATGASYPF